MYDNNVYYRTPELLGACSTAAVLVVIVVAGRRALVASAKPKWRSGSEFFAISSMVLLLGPFMYSSLSGVVALWWTRFVPQGVLISVYAGLLGAAWIVFSTCQARNSSERSSRSEASVC
jgi:protein-S-isoprenylcysteine O-methyltransferase Ste14